MDLLQNYFIVFLLCFSLIAFLKGFVESKKGNSFHDAGIFNAIGAFVWGDAVIFGLFWTLVSIFILVAQSFSLFLVIFTIFWLVRSIGETQYWINQQFSTIKRNPPKKMFIYKYFKNDSVWFIWQIYWQCLTVFWGILSIYTVHEWLKTL